MSNKDKRARHLRRGRPARGMAWLTESAEGGRGRHRLRHPSSGLMAMSAVLLAASAASSTVHASEAPLSQPPAPVPSGAEAGAGGNTPPHASFPMFVSHLASGRFVGAVPGGATGAIPSAVLAAYQQAYDRTNMVQPSCHIPLELLAAIGKVESGHARGGRVDISGRTLTPILGPVLDGGAFAAISDTDGGTLDGDAVWDRAVGPMQFIPGTWTRWAADGNVDGKLDPHNVYDASLAAARYLCAANRDLGTPAGLDAAVLSYNHSTSYLSLVRSWMTVYRNGTVSVDDILDPGFDPAAVVAPVPGDSTTPGSTPPGTPTPPAGTPTTPPPPTSPSTPTVPPKTPVPDPTEPPVTEPPVTEPPTSEPPASEPPDQPAPPVDEPADQCGLVDTVGNIIGGLLGEDPSCVHRFELATPETTSAAPATTAAPTTTPVPAP